MPKVAGRRKKAKTHKVVPDAKVPRSFVLRLGPTSRYLAKLQGDLRELLSPNTAAKLKERKSNTMRDFVDMAGPLGVTHMLLLSQTAKGGVLRLARSPHGPTLSFRISAYSTARAVRAATARPVDLTEPLKHPPLVVLHNFGSVPAGGSTGGGSVSLGDALRMTQVTFQNLFPPINPGSVKLSSCRRVLLLHYNTDTSALELRHYVVRAAPTGLTRGVRKVVGAKLPDLSGLGDVSEYVTSNGRTRGAGGGTSSAATSDSEMDDGGVGKVTLPSAFGGRGNMAASTSVVKLTEVGPRMSLTLMKITQGLCTGEVLYHATQKKTPEEVAALKAGAAAAEAGRAKRRAEQEANVERKAAAAEAKWAAKQAKREGAQAAAVKAAGEGTLGDGPEVGEGEGEEVPEVEVPAEAGGAATVGPGKRRRVEREQAALGKRHAGLVEAALETKAVKKVKK